MKSLHNKLQNNQVVQNFKLIWALQLPPKIKYFIWLIGYNRLPTVTYFYKLHITTSSLCPICHQNEETIAHILFKCPKHNPYGISWESPLSCKHWDTMITYQYTIFTPSFILPTHCHLRSEQNYSYHIYFGTSGTVAIRSFLKALKQIIPFIISYLKRHDTTI